MAKLRMIFALAVLVAIGFGATIFEQNSLKETSALAQDGGLSYEITMKRDLLTLLMAYPQHIKGVAKENGNVYVVMQSGKKIIYDDRKSKTFDVKLANADLQDMLEQVYPLSDIQTVMENNFDPGRIRNYAFFHEVYGRTQGEIEKQLTNVPLGSGSYPFNKSNQAAQSLKAAFAEIARLGPNDPVTRFVYPLSGTYNYRCIAGTNQLSPHAFGLAIDLHSDKADYWRWATKQQGQSRLDRYPRKLVSIFENHYFIWGGKWAHFDFLHFEYRPELIIKSKYQVEPDKMTSAWYCGYPDTETTRSCIGMIDAALP